MQEICLNVMPTYSIRFEKKISWEHTTSTFPGRFFPLRRQKLTLDVEGNSRNNRLVQKCCVWTRQCLHLAGTKRDQPCVNCNSDKQGRDCLSHSPRLAHAGSHAQCERSHLTNPSSLDLPRNAEPLVPMLTISSKKLWPASSQARAISFMIQFAGSFAAT